MQSSVTFPVSPDVQRGNLGQHTRISVAQSIRDSSGLTVGAFGANVIGDLVDDRGTSHRYRPGKLANGLLRAVHAAYADHLSLVFSPDDVWLALAQGFANHVNVHAGRLRSRFVAHEGQKLIEIIRDSFVKGKPDNDWPGAFAEFSAQIAQHVGDARRRLVVADFSTTDPISRAASEIVLMDAMRAYFAYEVRTSCGIPEVTLLGTRDDWRDVQHRAQALGEFDAADWVGAVSDVLDHFVRAYAGDADPKFWQRLYKPRGGSGGPFVTGWINVLFPYLPSRETRANTEPNKLALRREGSADVYNGPNFGDFPSGLSSVPFVWNYFGNKLDMRFLGGFAGVAQDPSGAVRPVIGWGVADPADTIPSKKSTGSDRPEGVSISASFEVPADAILPTQSKGSDLDRQRAVLRRPERITSTAGEGNWIVNDIKIG